MTDARATAWWKHLNRVRWFGGKGRDGAITALDDLPPLTADGVVPQVASVIATIDYSDGGRDHYHLLEARYPAGSAPVEVLTTTDGVDLVDATDDPDAVAAFARAVVENPGEGMEWFTDPSLPDRTSVWPGEQSNTTLIWGDGALFKLFRTVESGPNLDAEVLAALQGTSAATPSIYGRLTAAWPDDALVRTDLGVLVERVQGARDGWELASRACADETDFTADARALGEALARVHSELRRAFGASEASGDELADLMTTRLHAAAATAPALVPYVDGLAASFDALRGRMIPVQRVHGDFHLGQTLRNDEGWTIIDFEGEPAKSASERRAPDAVWRDVAGMLRSFDYARSAHAEPTSDAALAWAKACQDAFLAGYGDTDVPTALVDAYQIDKAAYEVVYETRNRPDWVPIPLGAIHMLSQTHPHDFGTNPD